MRLRLLYRDTHLVVADKPAGLAVHRGWSPDEDAALQRVRDATGAHVHPVHRLDRGASGALLFALHPEVAAALGALFASGAVDKGYVTLTRGVPPPAGVIDHPLPRGEERTSPRIEARTAFTRLEVFGRYSFVEARPLTGRLHQIRRHFKHLSCPIIGDVRYGKGEHNRFFRERFGLRRLFLHARSLSFVHPVTGAPLAVHAPLPPELAEVLDRLRADRL